MVSHSSSIGRMVKSRQHVTLGSQILPSSCSVHVWLDVGQFAAQHAQVRRRAFAATFHRLLRTCWFEHGSISGQLQRFGRSEQIHRGLCLRKRRALEFASFVLFGPCHSHELHGHFHFGMPLLVFFCCCHRQIRSFLFLFGRLNSCTYKNDFQLAADSWNRYYRRWSECWLLTSRTLDIRTIIIMQVTWCSVCWSVRLLPLSPSSTWFVRLCDCVLRTKRPVNRCWAPADPKVVTNLFQPPLAFVTQCHANLTQTKPSIARPARPALRHIHLQVIRLVHRPKRTANKVNRDLWRKNQIQTK